MTWKVTTGLDRLDVSILIAALEDPSPQIDVEAVDQLLARLNRIWDRKEHDARVEAS